MLRDFSPAAIEEEDGGWRGTARELGAVNAADAAPNRPDRPRRGAGADRFLLHQHQVRRYQERALDTYVGEPFRAIDWQIRA